MSKPTFALSLAAAALIGAGVVYCLAPRGSAPDHKLLLMPNPRSAREALWRERMQLMQLARLSEESYEAARFFRDADADLAEREARAVQEESQRRTVEQWAAREKEDPAVAAEKMVRDIQGEAGRRAMEKESRKRAAEEHDARVEESRAAFEEAKANLMKFDERHLGVAAEMGYKIGEWK